MGTRLPPGPATNHAAHCDKGARCASCRELSARVRDLEADRDTLRREVELAARRLQMVMRQLALAEERAGHLVLARAIRSVAAGERNLTPEAMWALLGEEGAQVRAQPAPAQRLGAREREVLRLITEGHRTPSIASHLCITAATVEVHRRNIMRKVGLHSVAALTKYALREGLTSL